jgi:glycogen phosphorylase
MSDNRLLDHATTQYDGQIDILAAAEDLAERIPDALGPLARVAYNYRWAWTPGGPEVFRGVDSERFDRCMRNPVRLLQESPARVLKRAAHDRDLVARAKALEAEIAADLERPYHEGLDPAHPVGFLCAEYGVHVSLPVYSGGLGALAGDLLKEASDQAVPLVAVGLMYRKGYFRQRIDASGWQHEYWIDTDPDRLPAALVTGRDAAPVTVTVPIGDNDVVARIWRVDVGRIPLFLLDTDCADNSPMDRWITGRLYDGDPQTRLAQYSLLGAGGVRALRVLGYDPGVLHLNEGHAALAPLELARGYREADGLSQSDALDRARSRTVFTTHTPVPAGNDSYPAGEIDDAVSRLAGQLGFSTEELLALGHDVGADAQAPFGVTQAALRMSRGANAVSRRHGEVAREMWQSLWPGCALEDVPIGHVTNGVHVPTWIGGPMHELLDRYLPDDWCQRAADPEVWAGVDTIPAEELWQTRRRQRAELITFVRARSVADRLIRGDVRGYVDAAARAFDPDVLTIGFARRVATYKRLEILTRDPDWTLRLLDGDRPVQVVLAGKAHPRDEEAKRTLQAVFGLKAARVVGERVVFLDDYDLASGQALVRGCDVWLNLPRPPLEASGTSGMKNVFNGGLQLSVLDGWWAEAYDDTNGWAISGEVDSDHHAQDERDAAAFHHLLDEEVLPAFYDRDASGLPDRWIELMRASLRTLGPMFSASRMLAQYVEGPYRG